MNDDSQGSAGGLLQTVRPAPGLTEELSGSKDVPPPLFSEVSAFDPVAEVESLLEAAAPRAHVAGLELVGKVCSGLPRNLVGDIGRLRQALGCLVDNAIRFTPRGEVVLEVALAREPSGEAPALFFQVRDTGRGMPPERVREVFLCPDGPGRKLRRTAQLVADLGGRLEVESVPEQGSVFRFAARFLPTADGPATNPIQPPPHLVGLRVLVADDNPTSRSVLAELLHGWGLRTTLVDGGQAALEVIAQADEAERSFEVLVLDARMPRLGGFSVTERLVEAGQYRRIIMLVSPPYRRNDESACERLRISDRVTKPIRRDQLLRALVRATAGL
jgi:two-component system sensor histidine kinase/response regulator